MEGLRIVNFPSIFKYENKILGTYNTIELLLVLIVSLSVGLVLKDFGIYAVATSTAIFVVYTFFKVLSPEEVGFAFIAYEARFATGKSKVFANELDQTGSLISLESVDGWIVKMNGKLTSVIEVYPVNFFYSTPSEQRSYIDGFRNMLNSIDFKIQIIGIAAEFDANKYMNRFLLRMKDEDVALNPVMRDVAKDYIMWLDSEIGSSLKRRYFVTICVTDKGDVSIGELKRRVETVISSLQRAGIEARVLDRSEILATYEFLFSRKNYPKNFNSRKLLVGDLYENKS